MAGVLSHQIGGTTTSTLGDRRSLLDKVLILDGKETPFVSMVSKVGAGTPSSMVFEWPFDEEEPVQDLATVDGTPVSSVENAQAGYRVIANRFQYNRTAKGVSTLSEFQNQAGVKSKKGYARLKALRQLNYCLEALMLSEQEVQVGTGVLPNKTCAVGGWLVSTAIATSGYTVDTDILPNSSQVLTTATASTTASTLNGAMGATWERGGTKLGEAYQVFCGRLFKEQISTLTGYATGTNAYQSIRSYNADLTKKVLWQTIDTFQGDWGKAELVPSLFLAHPQLGGTSAKNSRYAYGLKMSTWEMLDGDLETEKELAYDGSGWQCEYKNLVGLRCLHPKANWAIKATS